MRKLSELLDKAFAGTDLMKGAKGQRVLRQWKEIVGEQLASRSVPDRFEKGVVWVAVEGSAWAQELRLAKDKILARLNEAAGEKIFFDIRFGNRKPRSSGIPEPHDITKM